ncbi:hypothetical protein GS429_20505 [Natronorubrum sp. JWXQ-INN-674]|uniref:Halobacterial output domain-containing protein n=1 Tax=Natronorubrum halalkaliphilum TaxID=2691917 RepID=A0A6B0VSP1_9EURY|nr:HalOD1 output domain-containing protein [Natronorubrum halalkaliphilum]MXV64405.1 hypothetical protein [Natronorubrum halalkaliphilum]
MSSPADPSWSDGAVDPTQAIIEAVAAREGVDVTDVEPPAYEPLYTVVNPEALDRLFQTQAQTPSVGPSVDARVVLEYEGYEIVVHSDGRVEVSELSGIDDSVDGSISS